MKLIQLSRVFNYSGNRQAEIDASKGLGICLVVYRHVVTKSEGIIDISALTTLKNVTSSFDMDLFFFLAGFTLLLSWKKTCSAKEKINLLKSKIIRVIPAYLIIAFISVIAQEVLVNNFLDLSSHEILRQFLIHIFIPEKGVAQFLWFIYVLVLFYLSSIVIVYFNDQLGKLIFISFLLLFVKAPHVFAMQKFCNYHFYFLLGFAVASHYEIVKSFLKKTVVFPFILFILVLFCYCVCIPILFKISSIAFVLIFSNIQIVKKSILSYIGRYSYTIYLFNLIFISVALSINNLTLFFKAGYFIPYLTFGLLFLVGLIAPICLKKIFLSKYNLLARYF